MQYQAVIAHDEVRAVFEEATRAARQERRQRVVSISFSTDQFDPVDVFVDAQQRGETAVLWQLPAKGIALVGIGAERELSAAGPERFASMSRQWDALVSDAVVVGEHVARVHPGPGPVGLGGFAFAAGGAGGPWTGFEDGWLCLPRMMYGEVAGTRWVTVNTVVTDGTDPDREVLEIEQARKRATIRAGAAVLEREDRDDDVAGSGLSITDLPVKERWLAAVERVSGNIRAGQLEKAVLARSVRVELPSVFSIRAALLQLRQNYPECYLFGIARGERCFIGATPERIVHQERGRIKVACMAGSTRRGLTEAEDHSLGESLLADSKNVEEHKIVLRSILAALDPVCSDVQAASGPTLRKFANVQHLYTPVTARVPSSIGVLDLVSLLHPTPAIGGHPTAAALQLIATEEEMHRGWYAGPIGWMNAAGEGEFVVGIRSGLLRPGEAYLFAGCGIMGDSEPLSEYDESVLKLRPMMKALEAGIG